MRAPALYALLFFIAGILFALAVPLPALAYLGLALLATAVALVYAVVDRAILSRIVLSIGLAACGAFLTRLQLADFPNNHISHFTAPGGRARIVGVIADEPDIRPGKTYLVVAAETLSYHERSLAVCGKLRVRVEGSTSAFNYKDRVAFLGFVGAPPAARNPGAFDYAQYLAARGIHAVCNLDSDDRVELLASGASDPFIRSLVAPVREYIASVFDRYLSHEQSALLRGFLIGDVRFIPREVYARFKDTGTLHVLAASGSNVGYVVFTIFLVLRPLRLRKPYRYFPAIIAIVVFSFLAYNQPSVVRASVMAIVALAGMCLRRDNNWLNTISIAGLIVLAFRPLYVFDLGTQLSFAAAYALILFMPACEPWLPAGKAWTVRLARYILLLVIGSVIAQLGVVPILLHNFHSVPTVSFLANLVVVPLVGLITTLAIMLIFLSPFAWLASLLGSGLGIGLGLLASALGFFDALPVPQLRCGELSLAAIVAYYFALLILLAVMTRDKRAPTYLWVLLIAANVGLWTSVIAGGGSETRITILDCGKVPTIVVESPVQGTTLINAGGRDSDYDAGESVVLPFLRYRGVTTLNRIVATTAAERNIESITAVANGLDPSLVSTTQGLTPESAVFRLEFDSLRMLFLTQPVAVQELNSIDQPVAVLGLDWRLLDNPATLELVRRSRPQLIVILNYLSRYGHHESLQMFRRKLSGPTVIGTLESGAIQLIVAGGHFRVLAKPNS